MARGILFIAASILIGGTAAAEPVELSLKGHKFSPADVTVPANQKFQIKVTNGDEGPAEFESHDLKVEKIVVPGGTVTVTAGPLKPGTYQFFDDYHPDDAKGTVTAKE
ncbi:MAG TPA: cupredoxin domain-containing protein [Alphaproteobacteria bacterium]|jgi:heme/copper-type cytochrome/quinol oxidase subunit 2|nr:cupredoxin domain-containing protein [Alphaproteobacteria bacterium]